MSTLHEDLLEFRGLLQEGRIQSAYRGLIEVMMGLRTHFERKYPEWAVSGSLYSGVMDMTYFGLVPPGFKERRLKIAVVFVYETFRFEAWLAGVNKQVQAQTWTLFKQSGWGKHPIVPSIQGADSIVEAVLVENPDFHDLEALTRQIEEGTLAFIRDMEEFLAQPGTILRAG